jgi:dTMP kinase
MENKIIISIEGIDGCGKTTQSILLEERLQIEGFKAIRIRTPSENNISGRYLINNHFGVGKEPKEIIMMMSYDILTSLKKNKNEKIYIFDRYIDSAYASHLHKQISFEEINELIFTLPKPNFNFYLKISPEEVLKRKEIDSEAKMIDWQRKKMNVYNQNPSKNQIIIGATQTIHKIHQQIYQKIIGGLI